MTMLKFTLKSFWLGKRLALLPPLSISPLKSESVLQGQTCFDLSPCLPPRCDDKFFMRSEGGD